MTRIIGRHLTGIEPGTAIHIDPANGGGWLVSCPQCNFLRFVQERLILLWNEKYLDTLVEIECPGCGVAFECFGGEIEIVDFGNPKKQSHTQLPKQLPIYGRAK